jgi:Na+-translocating ferredoxin:NAD+ oxidoreductase RNF subunit RnfB
VSLVPDPVVLELLVVVDDIELEMLCAEFKLTTCVSGGEAVVDRTAELLSLRVFVPVILTFREPLEKLDVVAVLSEFPVSREDSLEMITEVRMVAEVEEAEDIEEIGI